MKDGEGRPDEAGEMQPTSGRELPPLRSVKTRKPRRPEGPVPLPILILQDRDGLVSWPWTRIACLREEFLGRLEATSADGEVAHRPGPIPAECPLPEVAPGIRVHPRLVTCGEGGLHLPDGRVLDVPGPLPPPPPEPTGVLQGTDIPLHEVLYLEGEHWVTERGRVADDGRRHRLAEKHPHLLRVGNRYVNSTRIRRISGKSRAYRVLLDNGVEIAAESGGAQGLARRLGLASLGSLEPMDPRHQLLFELGMRHWSPQQEPPRDPVERICWLTWREAARLDRCSDTSEFLEKRVRPALPEFEIPPAAEGAAPYEVLRQGNAGAADSAVLLQGALDLLQRFRRLGVTSFIPDPALYLFRVILHALCAELGLIRYGALGWERGDLEPGNDVLVLADSPGVAPGLQALRDRFGVSTATWDASPPAALLDRMLATPPRQLLGYTDFTPAGHAAVESFRRLLQLRGAEADLVGHLCRPERFTPTEVRCLAVPDSARTYDAIQRRRQWRRLHGRAPLMRAAHLSPPSRVVTAFQEEREGRLPTAPAEGPLRRPGVLLVEDSDSIRVVRAEEIVALEPEAWGRLQATLADGSLAWCPGPADPDWRERQCGAGALRGIGVTDDEVLSLREGGPNGIWSTDAGTVPAAATAREVLATHPHLVPAGSVWANLRRVHRLRGHSAVEFDTGEVEVLGDGSPKVLAAALGMPRMTVLPGTTPQQAAMLREGLRDWPAPLFPEVPHELTRAGGGTARLLIANLVWRTLRSRRQGPEASYGRAHRRFLYHPTLPALAAAGFRPPPQRLLVEGEPDWSAWFESPVEADEDPHWLLLVEILMRFVGHDCLCDYEGLGFRDPRPDLRSLGAVRPEVVVLLEKTEFIAEAHALQQEFGVTTFRSGGTPRLVATEFLTKELLRHGILEVEVLTFVDWDPKGHEGADTLVKHLNLFGCRVKGRPRHLVTPERFTDRELEFLSFPLDGRTLNRRWFERTGGIRGQRRGIHANQLTPVERVLEAAREVLGR